MSRPPAAAAVAATEPRAGFVDVLRVREFRWLFFADIQSQLGDQLARVALSILVFTKSGSALLTAVVFALTFLPAVLGGLGLGHLADVFPRRQVMIICDVARAILLGAMAIPGLPLAVVAVLLVFAVAIGAIFGTAESAIVTELVAGDRYSVAVGIRIATLQISQLAGFALGGLLVAWIGSRQALAVDAITFVLSAAAIWHGLEPRPAAVDARSGTGGPKVDRLAGFRAIAGHRQLRILLGLSWLSGLTALPEGIAAPYAHGFGGGATSVGLLLAANPGGTLIGTLIFVRIKNGERRKMLVGPLAVLGGVPLVACAGHPGLAVTMALWLCTGLCAAYHAQIPVEFMQAVPNHARGQAVGIASSGLYAIQGVGLVLGGALAVGIGTAHAVAAAGVGVILLGGALAVARSRQMALNVA